jgi:hypothetical protein
MMVLASDPRAGALGPFFGVEAYDDAGTFGLLGSFGVDATSLDLIYQAQDTGFFTETGVKAAAGVWHNFAISLDYARHEYTAYFDGQPLATTGFVDRGPLHTALDQLTDADISALASQSNSASRNATGTAYYDNFKIVNGVSGEYLRADGNGDGVVDGLDLHLWEDHYGLDYGGAGTTAVAAAAVAATPHAPAGYVASTAPNFESTRLEVSLAVPLASAADATPSVAAVDVTWLAYERDDYGGRLRQVRSLHVDSHRDASIVLHSAQRDAALAQLGGHSTVGGGLSSRWGDVAEAEDAEDDAELASTRGSALDALWAEF